MYLICGINSLTLPLHFQEFLLVTIYYKIVNYDFFKGKIIRLDSFRTLWCKYFGGFFFIILYNKTSLKYMSKKMVFNGLKKISIVVIIAKVLNFCI